jgi:glutaredoxin 3
MNTVKIYSTIVCPYCDAAKRLLKSLGVAYEDINLEGQHEERQRLSEANGGWRTVPMIFIGEKFIGGFDDLRALHSRGELMPMINGLEP